MSDTERSLLDAVLENPDDDLPRLVYADFLEEHGDATRAEFIRAQIAISTAVKTNAYDSDEYSSGSKVVMRLRSEEYKRWLENAHLSLGNRSYNVHTYENEVYFCNYDHYPKFFFRRGLVDEIFAHFSWIYCSWPNIKNLPFRLLRFNYIGRLNSEIGQITLSRQRDGSYDSIITCSEPIILNSARKFQDRNSASIFYLR